METYSADEDFKDTQKLELEKINEAVRQSYGISLEEFGPPGSIQRQDFISRFEAEQENNLKGE